MTTELALAVGALFNVIIVLISPTLWLLLLVGGCGLALFVKWWTSTWSERNP